MTEQLIEKLMKLDQLLKNQEEFMGSFAHEMKTPLTSIIGYADLMRMEALSKEEQKEACGYIYSEGKRLQNLSSPASTFLSPLFAISKISLPLYCSFVPTDS